MQEGVSYKKLDRTEMRARLKVSFASAALRAAAFPAADRMGADPAGTQAKEPVNGPGSVEAG